MPNALQQAGALSEPSNFAPLHTNRIFTGLWTNRSLLRDAATSDYQEHYGMGRQDSIMGGLNSEISPRLTLIRRAGMSVFGGGTIIPPVRRFYSFNTFTLTDEAIRVMADTAATVYDYTGGAATAIWQKSAGSSSTYFLSIGNILYFTNGADNKQWNYETNTVTNWGIVAPTTAPIVSQSPRPNQYPNWQPSTIYAYQIPDNLLKIVALIDSNNNIQVSNTVNGTTGAAEPNPWNPNPFQDTIDGTVTWENYGSRDWKPNNASYTVGAMVSAVANTSAGPRTMLYSAVRGGVSGAAPPASWPAATGIKVQDGTVIWICVGLPLDWQTNIGVDQVVTNIATVLDTNGYIQGVVQMGKTTSQPPQFQTVLGAYTTDTGVTWVNLGNFSAAATAAVQYGYAYQNATGDISDMSPASTPATLIQNNEMIVQGDSSTDPQTVNVIIYRTAQGGSTFFYLDTIPNPTGGAQWTYTDTSTDAQLNTELQAQVNGEGTPLPVGATCLGYHIGRVFAGVGNVVWISSGPDAVVAGSSGNSGFDTQLVAQSKIIRFWACSLGMVVFTVRDAYIILGSGTAADPLYMVVFIENLPLRNYDCFTVNKTTPYLLMGNNQLVALDPSAGIIESGFPIADRLMDEYDAAASFVTFHSQSSLDNALYVATGGVVPPGSTTSSPTGQWYRMAQNNAPEQGSAWSPKAIPAGGTMGCVQSVEVTPGVYRLLISGTTAGPVWQRDQTKNTDNGNKYAVQTVFGNIVLAQPGQLAALFFITLESVKTGTRAGLALLLGEISGTFEALKRTRQDPPILPPSNTLFSDRYHFAQNQSEAWCRHFQMEITWPAEDAANELLTFTIFGQTWQEMRSQ